MHITTRHPTSSSVRLVTVLIPLFFSILVLNSAWAADAPVPDWPPTLDPTTATKPFPGRKVEFFRHGVKAEWGYAKPQRDYFILVHPREPRPDSPLYVVLHSAGHDARSAYDIATEGAEGPNGHFLYCPPPDCYGLFPDCRANGNVGDWWWGGPQPNEDSPKNLGPAPTPAENRVEDTVKWVLSQYPTDRNRVYLTGISMGGSGSLGIGIPRGDLFASLLVHVPAGALHVEQRMRFPPLHVPEGLKYPDPPVVVAYSGVDDGWAKDQAKLLNGMRAGKFAFVDFWGMSGHDSTRQSIVSKNDLAFSFPWLEIKRNEAYPVFTDATSDSRAPWLISSGESSDQTGQINAFFRWKNIEDTQTSFSLELRLLKPSEIKSAMTFPMESIADVTLRRFQRFEVTAGKDYSWQLQREGVVAAKGNAQPNATGLLTIPKLTITQTPAVLNLRTAP